jgi:hypothetical protein
VSGGTLCPSIDLVTVANGAQGVCTYAPSLQWQMGLAGGGLLDFGGYTIIASYGGDTNDAPESNIPQSYQQLINPASTTVTLQTNPANLFGALPQGSETFTETVVPTPAPSSVSQDSWVPPSQNNHDRRRCR